uniref:Uncharacterized protein n=1 Tax=Micrurus corallinus TaxID=54390 RepID=A0A2D4GEY3_MICCO
MFWDKGTPAPWKGKVERYFVSPEVPFLGETKYLSTLPFHGAGVPLSQNMGRKGLRPPLCPLRSHLSQRNLRGVLLSTSKLLKRAVLHPFSLGSVLLICVKEPAGMIDGRKRCSMDDVT